MPLDAGNAENTWVPKMVSMIITNTQQFSLLFLITAELYSSILQDNEHSLSETDFSLPYDVHCQAFPTMFYSGLEKHESTFIHSFQIHEA